MMTNEENDDQLAPMLKHLLARIDGLERKLLSQDGFRLLQEEAGFIDGDSGWMMTASALVLFMTLPGLFLFYGGMARTKNVLAIIMQIFSTACLITFLWLCFGYSLAFAPSAGRNAKAMIFGDASNFWLVGITLDSRHQLAPTIPETIFCVYELCFAIITPCLMVGAFADRMKFTSTLMLMSFWHLLIYCPVAHSIWHPDGFLFDSGSLDYAGGIVVHVTSGISGLVACIYLGPRMGFGTERFDPHNILLTAVGASMLWVGWFGFNAGSALAATDRAGMALLTTQIATATAGLTWMITEWISIGHPTVLGLVSGAVSGLVTITPACGYVNPTAAFVLGLLSGPICYWGVQLKHLAGYDDALDAFGVHGIGGILGGLLLAFFANPSISSNAHGVFYSSTPDGGRQFANQLYAIVITVGWSSTMTALILWFVDKCMGLRVSEAIEQKGLDHSLHGQSLFITALTSHQEVSDGIEVSLKSEAIHRNKVNENTSLHGEVNGDGEKEDDIDESKKLDIL